MDRFKDRATRDIREGRPTKAARRAVAWYHHTKARQLLDFVYRANHLGNFSELAAGASFKELHGRLQGTYQVRIAGQYRIRFKWSNFGACEIQAGEFHDEG